MADISLPTPGQKPWSLNPAILAMNGELNGRLSDLNLKATINGAVSQFELSGSTTTAQVQEWLTEGTGFGVIKRLIGSHTLTAALVPAAGSVLDFTRAQLTLADGAAGNGIALSQSNVKLIGGRIDGNRQGRTGTSHGLVVTGEGVTIENTVVTNFRNYGVYGISPKSLTLRGLRVTGTGNIGIFVEGPTVGYERLIIESCVVDRSSDGASIIEGGIKVRGTSTNTTPLVRLTGNQVIMPVPTSSSTPICIEVWFAPGAVVSGNQTTGGAMGLSIINCDSAAIQGNTCIGPLHYGIEIGACQNPSASGNAVDGSGRAVRGFALTSANGIHTVGASITGNTVKGCTGNAIHGQNCDGLVLTSNRLSHGSAYVVSIINARDVVTGLNEIDGLTTATKGIVFDNCLYVTVSANVIRGYTQHGVLVYSVTAGYLATDFSLTGNTILSAAGVRFGGQFSNGAAWGSRNVARGNPGMRDMLDVALNIVDEFGTAVPEGAISAGIGSTYRKSNGGATTTLYVKESGTGNTGWVAK